MKKIEDAGRDLLETDYEMMKGIKQTMANWNFINFN